MLSQMNALSFVQHKPCLAQNEPDIAQHVEYYIYHILYTWNWQCFPLEPVNVLKICSRMICKGKAGENQTRGRTGTHIAAPSRFVGLVE